MSNDSNGRGHKSSGFRDGGRFETDTKAEPVGVDVRPNVAVGDRDVAVDNEILRTLYGSEVTGMAIENSGDRDEMGVYVELPEQVIGLMASAGHFTSRTVPVGVRSGPGDTDLTIYSLRRFLTLATAGNPTVLTLLYAPPESVLLGSDLGDQLQALAPSIVSQVAGARFLGYLDGQRERMTGGGKQSRVPSRPELVAAHGYDVKYASHALRLGLQGLELIQTGRLTLPLEGDVLTSCMEVKRGLVDFDEALRRVDDVRSALADAVNTGTGVLAPGPDLTAVNAWLVGAHQEHWAARA